MNDSQEDDLHNFSASPAHRLPTLNGAQALQAALESRRPISTCLSALDYILSDQSDNADDDEEEEVPNEGGISRGSVTEIYGPPGAGKTTFAIQLAANVLRDDSDAKVVWVDTGADVSFKRLTDFIRRESVIATDGVKSADNATADVSTSDTTKIDNLDREPVELGNLHHFHVPSFAHLLALLLHPPHGFPPKDATLLVLDDLSSVATTGLPHRKPDSIHENTIFSSSMPVHSDAVTPSRLDPANIISRSLATRRLAMISSISSGLQQLAASHNLAVVVLNQTAIYSNRNQGGKSMLRSVMSSQQWNENIATRLVIYRDHWPGIDWKSLPPEEINNEREIRAFPLRLVEVERLDGVEVRAEEIRFVVTKGCLRAVDATKPSSVKVKLPIADSPSPPNLNDPENEDLQNVDVADVDNDNIYTEPEDAVLPAPQRVTRSRKRKNMEVEDSGDEGEEIESSQAKLPPMPNVRGGFLPSSQLVQDEASDPESPLMTRPFLSAKDIDPPSGDGDMLLQ